jgi:hypothetical protein
MGLAISALFVGMGVIGFWDRTSDTRREVARRAVPSSYLGKASLWLLLAGLLVGPVSRIEGPVAMNFLDGFAPLGIVACALAIVAFARHHDRGRLLLVPVVVGFVLIATRVALLVVGA